MGNNKLIKYHESGLFKRVGNAISVTNKLLVSIESQLMPYRRKKKWGYCTQDKRIITECIYDKVHFFHNGLARVELMIEDGKERSFSYISIHVTDNFEWPKGETFYGFIDTLGNLVIKTIFSYGTENFSENLARININGKFGFINKTGEIVIEPIYSHAGNFKEGLASVMIDNKQGFINKNGNLVIPCIYGNINKSMGGFNVCGADEAVFSEEVACVKLSNKYGFIDKKGNPLTKFIYDDASGFSEGMAKITLFNERDLSKEDIEPYFMDMEEEKSGFINKNGEVVIPPVYDGANNFSHGLSCVYINGKYGFIDKTGQIVIPIKYEYASGFSDGLACVKLHEKFGYLDKTDKVIIPFIFENARSFSENLACVKVGRKYGYINKMGIQILPFKYGIAGDFINGLASVAISENDDLPDGFIDKMGVQYWED